ncbi:zinc finger, C2H2 type [Onchocerca flexuosa]|uniref:Zinc finger, C2H2 type n=1 Tax=Onchocerca flexuosa TaxID=387005 RepID=A0A238BQ97_9BILA|nr:zinc finger, C2H2 type [Onchocerca flexuosa]
MLSKSKGIGIKNLKTKDDRNDKIIITNKIYTLNSRIISEIPILDYGMNYFGLFQTSNEGDPNNRSSEAENCRNTMSLNKTMRHQKSLNKLEKKNTALTTTTKFKIKTEKQSLQCHICSMRFLYPCKLRNHMTVHTKEKKFRCDVCGAQIGYLFNFRVHMKKHMGEINDAFKCDVCGKQFLYQCRLRTHMHRHTDERSFKCNQCGKEFKYASNLKGHKEIHTDKGSFKCDECGRTFRRNYNLKRHRKKLKCSMKNNRKKLVSIAHFQNL